MDTPPMSDEHKGFWERFGQKHRTRTMLYAKIFASKAITRDQFAILLSTGEERMKPSKARKIYDYLKMHGVLRYPDAVAEGE